MTRAWLIIMRTLLCHRRTSMTPSHARNIYNNRICECGHRLFSFFLVVAWILLFFNFTSYPNRDKIWSSFCLLNRHVPLGALFSFGFFFHRSHCKLCCCQRKISAHTMNLLSISVWWWRPFQNSKLTFNWTSGRRMTK